MGFLQRMAAKGELKVMSQFDAEMRAHAPGIPVQQVQLPCHIITEWHTGLGVTLSGGSAGIYRCQGRFWSVPLTETELWQATVGMRTSDPVAAAQTMTRQRQDLGPLLPGGTMSLVAALVAVPDTLVVGGRRAPESGPAPSPDVLTAATTESPLSDAEAEQAYWDDLVDWYERRFPMSREGQLTAVYGVTARSEDIDWAPVLFDADDHGIQLSAGAGNPDAWSHYVYLRASGTDDRASWVVSLREDLPTGEREYETAGTELGSWTVADTSSPSHQVATRVTAALQSLQQSESGDRMRAFRAARATWAGIVLDAETAIEVLRAVYDESPDDEPRLNNSHLIIRRLKAGADLTADQRDYLEEWDVDDDED